MRKQDLDKINSKMSKIESCVHLGALLLICIGLTMLNLACTRQIPDAVNVHTQLSIEADMQDYVDAFVVAGKINNKTIHINDLIVRFQPDTFFHTSTELARCTRCYGSKTCTPEINVKRSWWFKKGTSDLNRRELMFHELGHCVLRLDHNNHKDMAGYPVSVMHQYHMGDNLYNETTISSYDTELFTGKNPTDFTIPVTVIKQGE